MKAALGALGLCSLGGLTLVAIGVLPWGVRGVAALTLAGLAWVAGLVIAFAVELYERVEQGKRVGL